MYIENTIIKWMVLFDIYEKITTKEERKNEN